MNKVLRNKKIIFGLLLALVLGVWQPYAWAAKNSGGEAEIKELNEKINQNQAKIKALKDKIAAYEKGLATERSKANSLKNQIYILNTQIEKKQAEIDLQEEEIKQTDLQIKQAEEKISLTQEKIARQRERLSALLREIYRQDQKKDIEIVLLYNSLSDFFNQLKYTESIQSKVGKDLAALKALKQNLAETKSELENKKNKLVALKTTLENTKANLEDQQQTKVYLLRQTRNSERRYRNLVAQLKAEQNRINNEIVSLEKTIRAKLNKGGANKLKQLGDVNFAWPVPSHVITTYFHDPDYPFRYIFEHPAIDIRAAQGTPLRAAASGYVAKVRDGGYGYSYIMLIHNNGFSTVYGHVSKIYVKPDEFVTQGEIIGLTGGMPGTPGAGRLTTGPHLHFEVRKNGIPVNPLDYLP